jgi:uncharacterized membrane protein
MTDERLETIVANLLRTGVSIAAAVVLIGGIGYLAHQGEQPANYHSFHPEPSVDRTLPGIVRGAVRLDWLSIIQFGLLLLIATPIARVAFALIAFGLEKDRVYVTVTAIVLAVLLYGLMGSH